MDRAIHSAERHMLIHKPERRGNLVSGHYGVQVD